MTTQPEDVHTSWVPDAEPFSSRLALLRHAMGWNAKEAALACNLPAQSWRDWEDGKHPRNFEDICEKISTRTGCEVVWLKSGFTPPGTPALLPRMNHDDGGGDSARNQTTDQTRVISAPHRFGHSSAA